VLIVDDAPSTRRLLRGALEHSQEFDVVGEAGDGRDAIDQARSLQPDLILLDLAMPVLNGANALPELVMACPTAMVVIVSGSRVSDGEQLLDAGATGYLPKGTPPFELLGRLSAIVDRPFHLDGSDAWDELDRANLHSSARSDPAEPRGRAIVYDPDPVVRALIARVLNSSDVVVVAETTSVPILLTAVDLAKPEFVVLDLTAAGQSSTATLSEIRQRSPHSMAIVYSSAIEWRESAMAAGATAFVSKPRIDELADRISHLSPSRP
jgi:DNA-binding NarL/FixJ family response regulator